MFILKEAEAAGDYKVKYLIKEGMFNSTYKVESATGAPYFMKLYDPTLVPAKLKTPDGLLEIVTSRKIDHENVVSYVADGALERGGQNYPFLVTEFFRGRLLSEYIKEDAEFSINTAKQIIIGVLRGLSYIHAKGFNHNDITPRNIILDEVESGKYIPRIIDLGHTCESIQGIPPFPVNDLTLTYCAPEQMAGIYGEKGDVFAAAAVLYTLIAGKAPWDVDVDENALLAVRKMKIRSAREKPLDIEALKAGGADETLTNLISCALCLNEEKRLTLKDFLHGLEGRAEFKPEQKKEDDEPSAPKKSDKGKDTETTVSVTFKRNKTGGGFADVAGMEELKKDLTTRVIWVLQDREKAEKYRLTPPNGMILYGPPGCGKTFFAQKFAEESGFKFTIVNGSDLGSTYIHGTQGKIADLFKKARSESPTILCFDEFDAFVPSRGGADAEHRADEVNEFLAQLNNCAKDGVFVIGTTNRLDMIDPAVLRKGRMDLHVEVPAPDETTRAKIFEIHLKGRPVAADIDTAELAAKTPNYASSDIAFIVNEAAMMAALGDVEISQQHLLKSISGNRSSLEKISSRPKVGF